MRQLGKIFGVSVNTIYNWENAKRFPRRAILEKLATFFGCKIDDLL
jgi:transcriptional regulator with XRE-family HTH domain